MITNHAPIIKFHLTRNSQNSVQFFVETSDGNCYLTRVADNLAELYHEFCLHLQSTSTTIDDRLDFLNAASSPRIRFTLVGSFDSLDEILQTSPELLLWHYLLIF